MPKHEKLKLEAERRGMTVEQMVIGEIESQGTIYKAAQSIGVYPWSIQSWLKRNGYIVERTKGVRVVKEKAS